MCIYIYIINKYTQYTQIYYVNTIFILDVINRFTNIYIHMYDIYDTSYVTLDHKTSHKCQLFDIEIST